jgi:DNA-binding transcriptional LysR family regulator
VINRAPKHGGLPADLRLGDLDTFFAVRRFGAVTSAARALGASPSHVSKTIAKLEAQLQVMLLSRGAHGVTLTDAALRILPDLEQAVTCLSRVFHGESQEARALNFAAPSFLVSLFLPVIARTLPGLRMQALELPPQVVCSQAPEHQFDLSLMLGEVRLPRSWHTQPVGEIRRGLLARPSLAAQLRPFPVEPVRLRGCPFITPVYTLNGQFVQADDDCPLGFVERKLGHKTQTLRVALDLAAEIDQLLFAPIVAARRYLESGALVEIPVRDWRVTERLVLACYPDRLLAQEFNAVAAAVERAARE